MNPIFFTYESGSFMIGIKKNKMDPKILSKLFLLNIEIQNIILSVK